MDVTLTAETGRPDGSSRARRRLRAEGKVPAVVYGLDQRAGGGHRRLARAAPALTTEPGSTP